MAHPPPLTIHTPTGHGTSMIAMADSTETIMALGVVGGGDSVVEGEGGLEVGEGVVVGDMVGEGVGMGGIKIIGVWWWWCVGGRGGLE